MKEGVKWQSSTAASSSLLCWRRLSMAFRGKRKAALEQSSTAESSSALGQDTRPAKQSERTNEGGRCRHCLKLLSRRRHCPRPCLFFTIPPNSIQSLLFAYIPLLCFRSLQRSKSAGTLLYTQIIQSDTHSQHDEARHRLCHLGCLPDGRHPRSDYQQHRRC